MQILGDALATALPAPPALDPVRLEHALAHAFDASTLAAGGATGPATLVLLGFRDQRPAGAADPALGFLAALAILDSSGSALGDVPYAEVTDVIAGLALPRPELGEAEGLQRWLEARTRPADPRSAPLPKGELARLLAVQGLRLEPVAGQLQVQKPKAATGGSWLPDLLRRTAWEPVHTLPDPGEGLIGVAALRELRAACGLAGPLLDDPAWARGTVLHHRHLWPRLFGLWS